MPFIAPQTHQTHQSDYATDVWCVSNRCASLLFWDEKEARQLASHSSSAGLEVCRLQVFGKPPQTNESSVTWVLTDEIVDDIRYQYENTRMTRDDMRKLIRNVLSMYRK